MKIEGLFCSKNKETFVKQDLKETNRKYSNLRSEVFGNGTIILLS